MHSGIDYWKNYMEKWFGADLIEKWKSYAVVEPIMSNGREIQLEVYENSDRTAPTIVFAHGIAGYARILLPFVIPLFEKGYNLVVPDMQGYGYNTGIKGDFEWNSHKENLKDAVRYSKSRFKGPVFIGGASMGGPLAYAASCEAEGISGLLCWCLWDFSDREFMQKETTTKRATYLLLPVLKLLSRFLGGIRLKTYRFVSYDTLTDSDEFNKMVKEDPQAGTKITLRGAVSLLTQSKPAVRHNEYQIPVLVLQPENDRMTPKHYTQKTFDEIGSEIKRLVMIHGAAHFPTDRETYRIWAEQADLFIRSVCEINDNILPGR